MKIYVGILATHLDYEIEFKKIWLENISRLPTNIQSVFEFYFLYNQVDDEKQNRLVQLDEHVYDLTNHVDELEPAKKDMLSKTVAFFNFILTKHKNGNQIVINRHDPIYVLRTNMSTLFQFEKLFKWFNTYLHTQLLNVYAGPYIDTSVLVSGTCIVMSLDICQTLSMNEQTLYIIQENVNYCDDMVIGIGLTNIPLLNNTIIKRLDFLEKHVVYHDTFVGDHDIFVFRFKSKDRIQDTKHMKHVMNQIYKEEYTNITQYADMLLELANDYSQGNILTKTPLNAINYSTMRLLNLEKETDLNKEIQTEYRKRKLY